MECGDAIDNLEIGYQTFGTLNEEKSNVVWVFHALTGNSNPFEWWPGLFGENTYFNVADHYIVCANMQGSCYGSTEPKDKYFPLITIADMVRAHEALRAHLKIEKIHVGIGGSMGGQQVLQWAVQSPTLFEYIVPVATNAVHSPWGIAFNEAQRMALNHPNPDKGIEAARAIGMLSYRNYQTFEKTQKDADERMNNFAASSYQQYQGTKLRDRFSPLSYYYLSKAMDSHHVGRNFGGLELALKRILSKCICIGVDTDLLFPVSEQKYIARHVSGSSFHVIHSDYGHDGFLIETKKIEQILRKELG